MVVFLGASFLGHSITTTAVDRKGSILATGSVPIPGARRDSSTGADVGEVCEVPQGEWVRAGCLALHDIYFKLPAKLRKLWGVGLAGPQGWIAIDPDFDPISPLRLTPGRSPIADFLRWLEANPKQRAHIFKVLSPKDFFRFRVTGGLAADVTQASATGLLEPGRRRWDPARLEEIGVWEDWLPPPFDSAAPTGRISEEGVRQTGIPGGIWFVAGSDVSAARQLSAFDPRQERLLLLVHPNALELRLAVPIPDGATGAEDPASVPLPEGWETAYGALTGWHSLILRVALDDPAPELDSLITRALGELSAVGRRPESLVVASIGTLADWVREWSERNTTIPTELGFYANQPDPGPALLAGLAKPVFRDHDDFYRKLSATAADAANH